MEKSGHMRDYEEFIDYYKMSNVLKCAIKDIANYIHSGEIWFFAIFVMSFLGISLTAFIKTGWISLLIFCSCVPFTVAWMIYVSNTPSASSLGRQRNEYLNAQHSEGCWENFCSYMSTQYVFEDSKPMWRSGFGMVLLSLAIGQVIGYFSSLDRFMNIKITSLMVQSSIIVVVFWFALDNINPVRRTKIHLAIRAIKRFKNSSGNLYY